MNLDIKEILRAANTKWNYSYYEPGLVGGHCIGVDPYYLTYKAKEIGYHPEIILAGRRINDTMGKYIADRTKEEMIKARIDPVDAKVAVFGLTFKENCPDLRNTKIPDIIEHLKMYGCEIFVTDPYADNLEAKDLYNINLVNIDQIPDCDVVVLAVSHDNYKSINKKTWLQLLNNKGVFIDVKSMKPKDFFSDKPIRHWCL